MKDHRRDGKTLIEMLVVILVLGVVTVMCATIMAAVMRIDGHNRTSLVNTTAHSDLSIRFRQDAHSSSAVRIYQIEKDLMGLEFSTGPETAVLYTSNEGRVLREAINGETTTQRDQYPLGCETVIFAEAGEKNAQVVLSYSKRKDREHTESPIRTFKIVAVRGKDLRFQNLAEGTP
jgi:type II secretory pathway pseudopilin PulG